AYLVEVIRRERITTLHFVPSMLQIFVEYAEAGSCTSVKRVMCSGEALSPVLAARLLERLEGTELHNLYGPTEAAVDVTAWRCAKEASDASVPIGRPISNTQIYILDQHGDPVPIGVAGEIHIGGVQVGRGYLNRPELTAERFVEDRFSDEAGARLYRTGDLGRWLGDGTIAYLGRNDFQVKIRGFRIELGEIEARLSEHAGVRDAAVIAREDAPGDKRLVAYYVGDAAIGAEELRGHLAALLPDYMVPSAYVHLELMPLTPNGKLDRNALPAPEGTAFAVQAYEPPQGEIEEAVARIWAELLGVERIGRHDNFFALGGHSLLAIQVVSRLRQALALEAAL
ncbi:non-ribosomal peptide synthetase, partial [Bradyrhizobium sp.]